MAVPRQLNQLAKWTSVGLPLILLLVNPWLLGGQLLSVQLAGFVLSVFACMGALMAERRSLWLPGILIACFTAFILIQIVNPAFIQEWQTGLRIWALKEAEPIRWLPSSIQSDFTDSSPARFLIIQLTAWFCGIAIYPSSHRLDRRVFLPLFVFNASIISLVGLIQVSLESRSILGIFQAVDQGLGLFFATLLYKNHAAAFFNLALACSLACFFAYSRDKRYRRSNPGGLFLVAATILFMGVIFTQSRFGFICALGIVSLFGITALAQIKRSGLGRKWVVAYLGLVTSIALAGGIFLVKSQGARHLKTLNSNIVADFSFKQRTLTYKSSWAMFTENPVLGWGAGNFRHGFRQFQQLDEEHKNTGNALMSQRNQNFFWQHAHNDYLEYLIELGLLGTILLFSVPGYFLWQILRSKPWKSPVFWMLFAGIVSTMVHALVDFPFRNPAVLLSWVTLLVITAKYCDLRSTTKRA